MRNLTLAEEIVMLKGLVLSQIIFCLHMPEVPNEVACEL